MTKEEALKKINQIPDPDIGISLVELGLIYDVKVAGDTIEVLMTLTTPFCPLAGTLEKQIKQKLGGRHKVQVSFTFDPPWSIDKISEAAKLKLGLLT
ncbi:MAG: metal-sulfur cluster assembly factor [Patescibacteria group bacterium]|nr:metal-sulfur cluster assembly factor [Patescibacteria group bacterium]